MPLTTDTRPTPTQLPTTPVTPDVATPVGERRRPARRVLAGLLTVAAGLLIFVALVVPDGLGKIKPGTFVPGAFLRIPLEGIFGAAVLIALPTRFKRPVAGLLGLGLGVLTVLKVANIGFLTVLGRRFNPALDIPLFGDGFNYLTETSGRAAAIGALVGVIALVIAVPAVVTLAVLRLTRMMSRHLVPATRTVTALVAAFAIFAVLGTQLYPGAPVASDNMVRLAKSTALKVPAAIADRKTFAAEAAADAFRDIPADQLLTALRGKDVIIPVIESYGRVALEDPIAKPLVDPMLTAGTKQLAAAGFAARSGFLTSSTFGGGSWLAHGSFQSGLWINNQQRYDQLVSGDRLTLTRAFKKAGWQTAAVEPGNTKAWPEGKFYGYDQVFDSRNLGYRGPRFGWSRVPDQYALAHFQQNVYAQPNRGPLMSEITLTSSHQPFKHTPRLIDWNAVGDGSVYHTLTEQAASRKTPLKGRPRALTDYAESIVYSVSSVISWIEKYGNDNLVVIMFGDHQPIAGISGVNASRDVPITILAKDPAVLDRISGWGWQDGLRPNPQAPVWKMDDFRDKFLTAFGTPSAPKR